MKDWRTREIMVDKGKFLYSRILNPDDYSLFNEHKIIDSFHKKYNIFRMEHEHRKWEYGLALKFLLDNNTKTVLEVGGGGSSLAPILYKYGIDVTVVDMQNEGDVIANQNRILGTNVKFVLDDFLNYPINNKYDAVTCISVLEHIPKHNSAFIKLLEHSRKLVFITVDFHPSGDPFSQNHLRTYNTESLMNYIKMAREKNFVPDNTEFHYTKNFVYQYTFASLALERGEVGSHVQ